jgi:ubiquinone/menaquinone biosynthesis C-methylase UbiE
MQHNYEFAEIYDIITISNQDKWFSLIKKICKQKKVKMHTALDLGTGTGKMAIALSDKFTDIVGVDGSWSMLEIAKEKTLKYPNIQLVHSKIANFKSNKKFNIVTGIEVFDHFVKSSTLQKAAKTAFNHLEKGGLLIFNIGTNKHKQDLLNELDYGMVLGKNARMLWQDELKGNRWDIYLKVLHRVRDNLFEEKEFVVHKRIYKLGEVKELLKKAGFKKINAYADFTLKKASEKSEDWLFVAQR